MKKTEIRKVDVNWREIKNECRHTSNKEDTSVDAKENFIRNILISEHSPIRLARIKWRWSGIKSWVSVHFARHWLGWEKWVSTQRSDRTGVNRDKSPQDTPVNMDIEANAQALINVARYRLCYQAAKDTREYMEDLKISIADAGQEQLSDVMVPNCIYRMGCPEFKTCHLFERFLDWAESSGYYALDLTDIQTRYDLYNAWFRQTHRRAEKDDV